MFSIAKVDTNYTVISDIALPTPPPAGSPQYSKVVGFEIALAEDLNFQILHVSKQNISGGGGVVCTSFPFALLLSISFS